MPTQLDPQTGQPIVPADLPAHARERLMAMRGQAGAKRFFTSDLSVNEFLLIKEVGFEAAGFVMGSSIYHIGMQLGSWGKNSELEYLTQAMYHARELAMSRMEEEADALGADGIIGVRLIVDRKDWGEHVAEFMAVGTAVYARDGKSWRVKDKPFQSDLSGQDFWTLLRAGYRPLGFVMGNCVYHVAHQGIGQWFSTIGRNKEMPNYTQALYDARELAMERMQNEATELGAEGIVGTDVQEHTHGWGSHVIEFFSVGTAVASISANHQIPTPQLVLTVND
jgi:uncharacterized protein YbjQ (UPF0145 family)